MDINKKYEIYNSMFLNLSYQDSKNIGHLLPLLSAFAKKRLEKRVNPIQILDDFIANHPDAIGDEHLAFMFKLIQYVERQIVLFDSIEDAPKPKELEDGAFLRVVDIFSQNTSEDRKSQLLDKINDFKVRVVLTAHPTQFYTPAVLGIIAKLREQIAHNNIEEIDELLHQLGLTSLINSKSPTPIDEAMNILHICRYNYYDALGEFYYHLSETVTGFDNPELITLGFWPCGDRDGNPFVTYETTREVSDALRMTLMKCYYHDVKRLSSKLTFKHVDEVLLGLREDLYKAMFDAAYIVDYSEILKTLSTVEKLITEKYQDIYLDELRRIQFKVNIFKNHFASLDIRQNHDVHEQTVLFLLKEAGIIKKSLDELSEEELVELLTLKQVKIGDISKAPPLVHDTIKNIGQLNTLQLNNGELGCHRYIISNSEDIFSVLFVFGLMRWIYKGKMPNFDIIPLFETMEGMKNSESIMTRLLENEQYQVHLKSRKKKQTMMLGFSDGTKDGGYLKANWSIYKSKETLTAVCNKYNIEAAFFDGRGGPPARGGGKTHRFYAAQGSTIANNELQLTIQGQTITSTYGTKEKFRFNAEQLVTSGLYNFLQGDESVIAADDRALIEKLSELSFLKYDELKNHEKFLPYIEKMTTLKYYSLARIGSRPSKRNVEAKLKLSDLRAIAYVGSWSQLKQNIPGYFGIGTAISKLKLEGRAEEMKTLYKNVPFFKTLIDNSMMSLTKCYFELTSYIKDVEEFSDFWQYLYDEYALSKQMILEITESDHLMQHEEKSKKSIQTREEIVLPLLIVQNYAIQKLLTETDKKLIEAYKKLIVRSLYGNINASRNSA
ncbi:MAG: phosphoenolpyruvate carboxylase [Flavobacteriaceae bacterium]|nr:phosphoenolpyruvate carboxylase [Flavobacteriaceae bacterium]